GDQGRPSPPVELQLRRHVDRGHAPGQRRHRGRQEDRVGWPRHEGDEPSRGEQAPAARVPQGLDAVTDPPRMPRGFRYFLVRDSGFPWGQTRRSVPTEQLQIGSSQLTFRTSASAVALAPRVLPALTRPGLRRGKRNTRRPEPNYLSWNTLVASANTST